ncbi:F-box only protein 15 [Coniochaeta hoffmannii]|uniref:F-box only protein 15 n=1 Tax=Coniochaeta hoffmannii TaxID=91930 RepID=A0AA38S9A5_9PEZI|nr:F-box only protein 15 [Coniochaeta hoffmannii]
MHAKRARGDDDRSSQHTAKRPRVTASHPPSLPKRDRLSPLSDELLLRILSFLSVDQLLFDVSPVSRRFHRLAGDSQLWKAHYYARFVLPRAMRIPGFREGQAGMMGGPGKGQGHKLHYSGRRRLWADGRKGGVVADKTGSRGERLGLGRYGEGLEEEAEHKPISWKRQYKIRHNWARGKCAVEELRLGEGEAETERKVLVKVVEGVAVTADARFGLRAWDLKSREVVAHTRLDGEDDRGDFHVDEVPSCIAIDEAGADDAATTVAVGFENGGFSLWKLHLKEKSFERLYQHPKSRNGELIGMALSFPYLLTATRSVLVSLYTFDIPVEASQTTALDDLKTPKPHQGVPSPYLLTSLKSHTSRAPLALSIRTTAATTIASIAYTFSTRNGWSIGMQDLHIKPNPKDSASTREISATKLAYTAAVDSGTSAPPSLLSPSSSPSSSPSPTAEPGPTTLCYTHPYLLAALPDNTLVLHLVTSTSSALTLSPGIRLWGHTSGISDAEITSRGKAVSVSERGDEMRVWELEGGARPGSGRSVEIRAEGGEAAEEEEEDKWEERKNWVGFDDEMVIVLKEGRSGRESLLVYDFT